MLNMTPYEKIKIKEQINLSKYLSNDKDFFFMKELKMNLHVKNKLYLYY